jgi:hypothetical protein
LQAGTCLFWVKSCPDSPKSASAYPWLEIECSRCRTPRSVDLCSLRHTPTTCVHDLASRLRCAKCRDAGKRPAATLLQLGKRQRHIPDDRS